VSLILFIVGFNILILVHELGHYIVARMVGMRATRFSIGFGPAIFRFHGKETVFQFALIPFGGYVQLEGLTRERSRAGQIGDATGPTFMAFAPWKRAAVMLAGPMANFLLAVVTYTCLFASTQAVTYAWRHEGTNVVREVSGPAQAAGIRPYDVIEAINGRPVRTFSEFKRIIGETGGQTIRVLVRRSPDGSPPPLRRIPSEKQSVIIAWPSPDPTQWTQTEVIELRANKTPTGYVLGITPDVARFGSDGWLDATRLGCLETYAIIKGMVRIVGRWFEGTEPVRLASVVKMADTGADTLRMGGNWFISFLAILSINLGIINLFPLPALDGGRLLFVAIEMVARRPVPHRVETIIHGIGMLLLMALMVVIVVKEILEKFE
jgi:regulator of sigma E protease